MTSRRWRRSEVALDVYWEKGGRVYKTLGVADEPTVEVQDLVSGKVETHVISSLNFAEFKRLSPETPNT